MSSRRKFPKQSPTVNNLLSEHIQNHILIEVDEYGLVTKEEIERNIQNIVYEKIISEINENEKKNYTKKFKRKLLEVLYDININLFSNFLYNNLKSTVQFLHMVILSVVAFLSNGGIH